jgi:FkbM family methyltransferase
MGFLKNNPNIQYPYFLKHVIKEGDVVIDIGANLGYYSRLMAKWVGKNGKIYAVEPVEPIRNVLSKNAKKFSCIEILPYALGVENRSIQLGNNSLHKNGYVASGSHFVMEQNNDAPDLTFNAEMRKGSELFSHLERLDFIKCDVEGYEIYIILEIASIIEDHKPVILIETSGENREKIIEFLQDMDYAPYVLKGQKLYPLQLADTDDILFVHRDKRYDFLK